ncbi:MAG: type II secretion system F family protein [Desulfuromonadales bacterium]
MNALLDTILQRLQSPNVILFLVFATIVLIGVSIYVWMVSRKRPADRLTMLLPEKKKEQEEKKRAKTTLMEEEETGLVVKFTEPLHRVIMPRRDAAKSRIRRNLLQAGYRSRKALRNYLSLKIVLALLLPGLFLMQLFFIQFTPQVIAVCAFLAVVGFFLPNYVIHFLISRRQREIVRALPDALDLMVICVEAGLGLDMTFNRVGQEIRSLSPHLSDEFNVVTQEIRAGRPRVDAYAGLSGRTGVEEISNLMTVLTQTSRFGTSVAQALRVHADAMRIKRRQRAEEIAAKAAVKLIFPLVLFIFPAMFVVLLGPAALRIYSILFPELAG